MKRTCSSGCSKVSGSQSQIRQVNMNAKGGLRRLSIAVSISVVVSAFQAASPASAADLTVVCPGGGPGAYPTITAALNAITNNEGPNSISVSGTCTENVVIFNQNNLYIHNAPGSTAVITNAASPAQITVQLFGSRLVTFDGLSIQGGNPGLFMNQGSDLQMFNSVLEKNVGDGATVLIKSDLNFGVSCIIRNNGGNGLLIGDSSLVVVMSPTQILNNNGSGVNVFSSGYIKFQSSGGQVLASWPGLTGTCFSKAPFRPWYATTVVTGLFFDRARPGGSMVRIQSKTMVASAFA